MRQIYFDYNATTPVHPAVIEAFSVFYRESFGNPSSIHWAGRAVKGAIEEAREKVAGLVSCDPVEVVFTSSGTEADNMAIKGVAHALRGRGNRIITSATEHPAVLNPLNHLENLGFDVIKLAVNRDGLPDLTELAAAMTDKTILVSFMYANHETGTINPVREIGEISARHKVYFHCDAVQALGKIPVNFRDDGISLMAISWHKLYAPKGIGALIVRKGVKLAPLMHGGPQERNRRAGTENVAGIVAFGKACEIALNDMTNDSLRIRALRDRLENGILAGIPEVRVNGFRDNRLHNTSCLSFLDADAESIILNLDIKGIAVSSGSACASGTVKASPVLAAMGVDPGHSRGAIRFSLGRENSAEEIDFLLQVFPEIVARVRGKH